MVEDGFVRRKEALALMGVTRDTFEKLIELGHVKPRWVRDKRGRQVGYALYWTPELCAVKQALAN